MATASSRLDARQKPPEQLKALFKKYQNASEEDLENDPAIIDLRDTSSISSAAKAQCLEVIPSSLRSSALEILSDKTNLVDLEKGTTLACQNDASVYQVLALPGVHMIPALLSPALQTGMLNRLLHRDLADPNHKTNLHLHYNMLSIQSGVNADSISPQDPIACKRSLFSKDPSMTLIPRDSLVHKKLSLKRALEKKLRWVTLGGQYDWTAKEYPREHPPPFPPDIAKVLISLFPQIHPQAAILNFYSPKDTLSLHRDVSEECDRGLISLSFGCDAIFVAGNDDGSKTAAVRLRSGDALLMSEASRFAWHGVPKVLAGTCPQWLEQWPMVGGTSSTFEQWQGWMAGKRINLNVRQMHENSTIA